MRKLIFILLILVGSTASATEYPTVNLPTMLRQENWVGPGGRFDGSCVHASICNLFVWQGRPDLAQLWRKTQGGGVWGGDDIAKKLNAKGVRFAQVTNGDVKFLEWALRTRRGCGVCILGGAHMVNLVYLDAKVACLLDNNPPPNGGPPGYTWVKRETFIAEWKNSTGWAVTPVYTPMPPLPRK